MSSFSYFSSPIDTSTMVYKFGPPKELLLAPFLDKEVLVLLIEDRKVYGCLRSLDHHGNVVLEGARERIIVDDLYCDVRLGLFVIRGESTALIGDLMFGMEELPENMMCVTEEEIRKAQKVEKEAKYLKNTMMKRMGFLELED